jgi:hypothetical protein
MKKHILLFLCLLLSHLSFSQISIELIGGVGFDIQKYETKYLYGRTPLMHEYTSSNGSNRLVKFEVLEPQNIGVRFLWKFSKKLKLSVGLEGRYVKRKIAYAEYNKRYIEMDIDFRKYQFGLFLRKTIEINENNQLFIQSGIFSAISPQGLGLFSVSNGLDDIPEKNRQLVQYRADEEYYNLIQIEPGHGELDFLMYQFSQGYLMNINSKLSVGVSSTVFIENKSRAGILIWAWNNDLEQKAGAYTPTYLKFKSVMFDLFVTYEF